MKKIDSSNIELAVARLMNPRMVTMVPNVSWGLDLNHECDLLCLDKQGRFTEVEIKISKADLMADFKKPHQHSSKIITRLIYAVPRELVETALEVVPKHCGIISVRAFNDDNFGLLSNKCVGTWVRYCKHTKRFAPIEPRVIRKFMHLGCMRIWNLKETIEELSLSNNRLRHEQNKK